MMKKESNEFDDDTTEESRFLAQNLGEAVALLENQVNLLGTNKLKNVQKRKPHIEVTGKTSDIDIEEPSSVHSTIENSLYTSTDSENIAHIPSPSKQMPEYEKMPSPKKFPDPASHYSYPQYQYQQHPYPYPYPHTQYPYQQQYEYQPFHYPTHINGGFDEQYKGNYGPQPLNQMQPPHNYGPATYGPFGPINSPSRLRNYQQVHQQAPMHQYSMNAPDATQFYEDNCDDAIFDLGNRKEYNLKASSKQAKLKGSPNSVMLSPSIGRNKVFEKLKILACCPPSDVNYANVTILQEMQIDISDRKLLAMIFQRQGFNLHRSFKVYNTDLMRNIPIQPSSKLIDGELLISPTVRLLFSILPPEQLEHIIYHGYPSQPMNPLIFTDNLNNLLDLWKKYSNILNVPQKASTFRVGIALVNIKKPAKCPELKYLFSSKFHQKCLKRGFTVVQGRHNLSLLVPSDAVIVYVAEFSQRS
eukprot:TRINITY_DN1202_c0_g1_i1.p1 TRINITY_DN1202_c0_g1~~TRINITY_DN1202_c0_g1_i1.p1  ORF type:complete len:472 (-),score=96.02 TRINITY_DN1202_c0_g1_i1:11-1426(-)